MLKKISVIIIIIMLYIMQYSVSVKYDYYKHIKIIDSYNKLKKTNILGYIEFKDVKREIVFGMTIENLDKKVVVTNNNLKDNNILLAGHNIPNVFRKLYELKKNDKVVITSSSKNVYIVDEIKTVDINYSLKEKDLILITCANDNKNRLVIYLSKLHKVY